MKFNIIIFLLPVLSLFAGEVDLSRHEKSLYSQNGEDGVLAKIFQLIPPKSHLCVEIGASDGITGSPTYLLRAQKWDCLLFDRAFDVPKYNLRKEFVAAENVNQLLAQYGVHGDLDLLVINIGYNDYYIWKALSEEYKPAVVLIGYNAALAPTEDKVVKYRPFFSGDDTNYRGGSILALYNLGRSKGYSLVYADQSGEMLFFIRDELVEEMGVEFKDLNDVEKLYRSQKRALRADPKGRAYISSAEL